MFVCLWQMFWKCLLFERDLNWNIEYISLSVLQVSGMSLPAIYVPHVSSPFPVPGSCCSMPRTTTAFAYIWSQTPPAQPSPHVSLCLLPWTMIVSHSPLLPTFLVKTTPSTSWGWQAPCSGNHPQATWKTAFPTPLHLSAHLLATTWTLIGWNALAQRKWA